MIHVYTGPTLSPDDPVLSGPQFAPRPPIRHGDLFDSAIAATDTVVIIDGLYHHTPAVRHKEIIWALGRGVRVVGAASIGALRAAELASCGMVGVGEIYDAYAAGMIEGDDEVAVGQSADAGLRAVTWPLVNLRHVLKLAVAAGVIGAPTAAEVLRGLRGVYYPHRSLTAVLVISRERGAEEFAQWLTSHLAEDRHFGDLKRADALRALEIAASLAGTPAQPPPALEWRTRHFRQWANTFAVQTVDGVRLATSHRVTYQQIFDRHFPHLWWDYLSTAAGSPGMPALPRPLACVVIRPETDLTDRNTVARLLAHETPADRSAIARYIALNEDTTRSHRGFFPDAIKNSVARRLLTSAWSMESDALEEEAWARGFQGARDAVEAAKVFVLGFQREQREQRGQEAGR
ncbi:TfuA-like protein [Streptomyces sp. NPDC050804]|uniref:TfuA-like protein n=1 Tax=Streptomyces sp. NPDC050804 TaxID=3154745 RepID=UPI003445D35B